MSAHRTNPRSLLAVVVLTAVAFLAHQRPAVCAGAPELQRLYDYDRRAPLEPEERSVFKGVAFEQFHIEFAGANGKRVTALLNLPENARAPFPVILFQHGYHGDKRELNILAPSLASVGYASMSIDAVYHGERKEKGKDIYSTDLESDRLALMQTVLDLRRALDYLETRRDIDKQRMGFIGFSMGGNLGAVLSVDERIRATVLVVGGGDWKLMVRTSVIGPAKRILEDVEARGLTLDEALKDWDSVEPLNFIGMHAGRPLLMINGKSDRIVPVEATKRLFEKAQEPKAIKWVDGIPADPTGHFLPAEKVRYYALKWFNKWLK